MAEDEPTAEQRNEAILTNLYNEDPELRRQIQRKLKAKNPKLVFPELETEDAVASVTKTFGEKLEETKGELKTLRAENAQARKHAAWREAGYEPSEIERVITQYGIIGTDKEPADQVAMRMLDAEAISAESRSMADPNAGRMVMQEDFTKVKGKGDQAVTDLSRKLAHDAITELQQSRRQTRGFRPTAIR